MQYDLARQTPYPGEFSACPCCYRPLLAKCGAINRWHWAHESLEDCDNWYEPMSDWHLEWQARVKESCREIVIGEHRADIQLPSGRVVEIQHSPISVEEVEEREAFYGNMTWIFDAQDYANNFLLKEKVSKTSGNPYVTFRWKRPRKSILACSCFPLYFDLGDTVLEVKEPWKEYQNEGDWGVYSSYYGWGYNHLKNLRLYIRLFGFDYAAP